MFVICSIDSFVVCFLISWERLECAFIPLHSTRYQVTLYCTSVENREPRTVCSLIDPCQVLLTIISTRHHASRLFSCCCCCCCCSSYFLTYHSACRTINTTYCCIIYSLLFIRQTRKNTCIQYRFCREKG